MKEIVKQLESENKKTVKSYERNIKDLNVKLKNNKSGLDSKPSSKNFSKSKEKPKTKPSTTTPKPTKSKLGMADSPKSVKSKSKSKSKSKIKKNEESKFSVSENESDYYSSRHNDTSHIRSTTNLQPLSRINDYTPHNIDMLSPISNGKTD